MDTLSSKMLMCFVGLLILFLIGTSQSDELHAQTPEDSQIISALNALINDPNCILPCWWKLTVGMSTLGDLQNLASSHFGDVYAQQEDSSYIRAAKIFEETASNTSFGRYPLRTTFWFRKSDTKLSAIGFDIDDVLSSHVNYYAYTPRGIVSTYGEPDEVTLDISTRGTEGYYLRLAYHDLRLFLSYYMGFEPNQAPSDFNAGFPVCNNHIFRIRLWVESESITYSELMQEELWDNVAERLISEYDVAGVSNISIEEFTQLFSQPDTCFQSLPLNQWVQFASTPTPVPQNASLEDWITLLTPTSSCPLPCWWDIHPGVTTLDQAEIILQQRFTGITLTREPVGTDEEQIWVSQFRMMVGDKSIPPIGLHLVGNDDVVDHIELSLPGQLNYGTDPALAWEPFAIQNLLQSYGTPSIVRLVALHEDGGLYLPAIILYWDSLGMVINYDYLYEGTWQPDPNEAVCYSLENMRSVTVRLQNLNSPRTLEELSYGFGSGTVRLSDISYLTNEQFAQIVIQGNGCIPPDFPADIYATPTPAPICNLNPSTPAELITAIQTANGTPEADTICLAQNGMYTFTSAHASLKALPAITSDLKIIGNGATLTRQTGSPAFRFFEVASNGTLTLENLTLSGAEANDQPGGAILNTGNLTVNNVTFSGNHAGTWR